MWILESNGDFLQGKRMWLRPGRKYLFGRVKKNGVQFAIDDKTVSRKHFIIEVAEVAEVEVSQIHARTKVTIIDQDSKSGTWVNGYLLKGTDSPSRDLSNTENSVRPGNLPHELIVRWQPCVLTFHLLKKDLKAGVLGTKQARLRPLGVKAISDFVSEKTTHVVASKRNTPKGLQALICGKYLVTDSYIDALEYAATPTNLDEEEDASPLERDFDSAWPAAQDHLPPPGREPTVRALESYQPGADRSYIFEHYTFVFAEQTQYDTLLPAITTGHGKSLLFKVVNGVTTVDEAYQFMANAAGRKGFGDPADDNEKGGVIMIQWNAAPEHVEFTKNLIQQLALKLDQRAIDQSEFLDAILANDASLLRQSLPLESNLEGRIAPPPSVAQSFASIRPPTQGQANGSASIAVTNGNPDTQRLELHQHNGSGAIPAQGSVEQRQSSPNGHHESVPAEEPTTKSRRDRFKMPPPSQKAFDDGFDPDAIFEYDDEEEIAEPSQVHDSEEEEAPVKNEPHSTRKRRRSPSPEHRSQSLADDMDDLFPAANAMKKRKLEIEAEAKRKGLPNPFTSSSAAATVNKPKKKEVEIDVRKVARAQREKEEEAAKRDRDREEDLPPHDETDRAPANLAVIEYMDLPVRSSKLPLRKHPEDDPRWDPRWNGRKNFKKFRPQEVGGGAVKRGSGGRATKVIVPLVEVKKNSGGLGDKYWDKPNGERERDKRRREKERRSQQTSQSLSDGRTHTQTQSAKGSGSSTRRVVISDDEGDEGGVEEDTRHPETSPSAATKLQEEAAAIVDHEIDLDSPRRTRGDDTRSQTQRSTTTQKDKGPATSSSGTPSTSRTQGTTSAAQTQRGTKRPAARSVAAEGSAGGKKRQKTLPVVTAREGSDGEESDDMKFKFGRRRKARA